MKQYLSYTLISLWSVLYTLLIRLEPNPFCVSESLQFIVSDAAAAPMYPFLEDYLASESRYLNSCQSCVDFRVR